MLKILTMKEILAGPFLLLLFMIAGLQVKGQNLQETKENPTEQLINGYHPSEFYYNNIQLPAGIENSEKKEDKINVAVHYKIVAYEKQSLQPINSGDKNELEAMLARFQKEAEEELGFAAQPPPQKKEEPVKKPSIITEENR